MGGADPSAQWVQINRRLCPDSISKAFSSIYIRSPHTSHLHFRDARIESADYRLSPSPTQKTEVQESVVGTVLGICSFLHLGLQYINQYVSYTYNLTRRASTADGASRREPTTAQQTSGTMPHPQGDAFSVAPSWELRDTLSAHRQLAHIFLSRHPLHARERGYSSSLSTFCDSHTPQDFAQFECMKSWFSSHCPIVDQYWQSLAGETSLHGALSSMVAFAEQSPHETRHDDFMNTGLASHSPDVAHSRHEGLASRQISFRPYIAISLCMLSVVCSRVKSMRCSSLPCSSKSIKSGLW